MYFICRGYFSMYQKYTHFLLIKTKGSHHVFHAYSPVLELIREQMNLRKLNSHRIAKLVAVSKLNYNERNQGSGDCSHHLSRDNTSPYITL